MREYEAAVSAFTDTPSFTYGASPKQIRFGYQYREFESFWAIIKSDSFWATDARFSNDAQEQRFAADIFANQLKQGTESLAGLNEDYIVCFCAEDDKLSQWRGYAAKGGVSMGFDFDGAVPFHIPLAGKELALTMPAADYRTVFAQYGQVLYVEPRREGETDKDYYTKRYSQISNTALQENAVNPVPKDVWDDLQKSAPFIKHKGFEEENEWRLVFRNEDHSLSPCVRYHAPDEEGIRRPYIVVRPGDPASNARRCVVRLCVDSGLTHGLLRRLRTETITTIDSCRIEDGLQDKTDAFCFGCTRRRWMGKHFTTKCRYRRDSMAKYRLGVHKDENSIIISQGCDQEQVFKTVHDCVEKFIDEQRTLGNAVAPIPVWCEGHLPIRSLTIGPCTHQREMVESVQHYCNHAYWLQDVKIKASKIPFRRST